MAAMIKNKLVCNGAIARRRSYDMSTFYVFLDKIIRSMQFVEKPPGTLNSHICYCLGWSQQVWSCLSVRCNSLILHYTLNYNPLLASTETRNNHSQEPNQQVLLLSQSLNTNSQDPNQISFLVSFPCRFQTRAIIRNFLFPLRTTCGDLIGER